jgi:hypothetical protein
MGDIFEQYKKLLMPQEMKDMEVEINKLHEQTNIYKKYINIETAFNNAKKINFIVKQKMNIKHSKFIEQYQALRCNFNNIYFITTLTKELQDNFNEEWIVARNRNRFGAKINMVINTTEYGTNISFPSLVYFTNCNFDALNCRDAREIHLQLFKIQYMDRIKECIELHKKLITPYLEKTNKLFEETKTENSKYFVLEKI